MTRQLLDTLLRPRSALRALATTPTWMLAAVTLAVGTTLVAGLLTSTDVGRLALLDQWERAKVQRDAQGD